MARRVLVARTTYDCRFVFHAYGAMNFFNHFHRFLGSLTFVARSTVWFSTSDTRVTSPSMDSVMDFNISGGWVMSDNTTSRNACLTLMAHFDADSYLDLSTANLFVKSSAPAIWVARLSGFM